MKTHKDLQELLPFYVSGALEDEDRQAVAAHLRECPACREEVQLWRAASDVIAAENAALQAPPDALPNMLAQLQPQRTLRQVCQSTLSILKAQVSLVRSEIWSASFLIVLIGFIAAVLLEYDSIIYALAPLVASAGVGMIYGKENDPAYELVLSSPVSQAQILLARLSLVFGYDLILVAAAYLGLTQLLPEPSMSALLLNWLAPMALLSSLSLLLSVVFGSSNAITIAYLLWMSKYIVRLPELDGLGGLTRLTNGFWENSSLMLSLSGVILLLALLAAQKNTGAFKFQSNA